MLTGETGAGKSILIDSIHAILGNRVSRDLVRTGAPKAVIRAAFEQVPASVQDKLEQAGYERTEALLLSREITAEEKQLPHQRDARYRCCAAGAMRWSDQSEWSA